jgi:DNA-binding response OmpR family regulator
MRILIVEDDPDLATLLALGLRDHDYVVEVAGTRRQAEELLHSNEYDLLCLDLGLPDGDGMDLVAALDAASPMIRPRRLLILTARDAVADRVAGLDAGADDYLVKPFEFTELLARVRALNRRELGASATVEAGGVRMDLRTHEVWRGDQPISLTPREYAVLRYLLHHPGRVVSSEELIEHVWDPHADPFTGSVRVILSRLRKKLGPPSPIDTVDRSGYLLRTS